MDGFTSLPWLIWYILAEPFTWLVVYVILGLVFVSIIDPNPDTLVPGAMAAVVWPLMLVLAVGFFVMDVVMPIQEVKK